MSKRLRVLAAVAVAAALPMGLHEQIGTFAPDWTFTGSALTGTRQMGQVTWRAENGEIVVTPTSPAGGWLLLSGAPEPLTRAAAGQYRVAPAPPAAAGARAGTARASRNRRGQ